MTTLDDFTGLDLKYDSRSDCSSDSEKEFESPASALISVNYERLMDAFNEFTLLEESAKKFYSALQTMSLDEENENHTEINMPEDLSFRQATFQIHPNKLNLFKVSEKMRFSYSCICERLRNYCFQNGLVDDQHFIHPDAWLREALDLDEKQCTFFAICLALRHLLL